MTLYARRVIWWRCCTPVAVAGHQHTAQVTAAQHAGHSKVTPERLVPQPGVVLAGAGDWCQHGVGSGRWRYGSGGGDHSACGAAGQAQIEQHLRWYEQRRLVTGPRHEPYYALGVAATVDTRNTCWSHSSTGAITSSRTRWRRGKPHEGTRCQC